MLDKLREIILFVAGLVALGSLVMAVYEGFSQRLWSATFLSGLALACIMVVYLPQLEVLKAFGMEAKLRETYKEAVATLATVRRLSEISARASYLTIAWNNRFGTPPAKERQAVLDEIDAQLTELKVTPRERATIVQPWVQMIKADFFFVFTRVIREIATLKASEFTHRLHTAPSQEATDASIAHSERITPWSKKNSEFGGMERLKSQSLAAVIDQWMPSKGGWLSDKELAAIDTFKNEIIRLNDDSEKRGGYTPEAAAFYDGLFEREADKAKELWALSKR
jgi:hypothetical protein